ncbi:MAG: helix-turn-helix domain-containing protein [Clostridiales bacterium]
MEYLTVKEAGEIWNVSGRMVTIYCNNGKIDGAIKKGNLWLIPIDAEKPLDGRTIKAKKARSENEQKNDV